MPGPKAPVHVGSALSGGPRRQLATRNRANVPPGEPEFSGRQFAQRARSELDGFIRASHAGTLRLAPPREVATTWGLGSGVVDVLGGWERHLFG